MGKVLVVSGDAVNRRMGGTAIRYWEFARCLSQEHDVTLAIPNETDISSQAFPIVRYNLSLLAKLIRENDVIVAQRLEPLLLPLVVKLRKPTVIDMYSPYPVESLAWLADRDIGLRRLFSVTELSMARLQLQVGDFFLCATERQRDFWIGALATLGRMTPSYYDQDENLEGLISVVPFGLPSDKPQHTKQVLKGVDKRVQAADKLLIWNGGLWSWLDPLTLIRAVSEIAKTRDDVKLFFMGGKSPNPNLFAMTMYDKSIQLSQDLGLYDHQIIFNEDWIPYEERQNYLLEADIGVSVHHQHIETRLSFRTRILDCIWANLPVVVSDGDSVSTLVRDNGLGSVVAPGDAQKLAQAILELLDSPDQIAKCKANLTRIAQRLTWQNVITPLRNFCRNPQVQNNKLVGPVYLYREAIRHYARRVLLEMRIKGIRETFRRIQSKVQPW